MISILDQEELAWLKSTLGARIAVYDHGGHLGNLGDRQQVSDMLDMLGGPLEGGRAMNARGILFALAALARSSGCATQEVRYRSWPAETPAADNAAAIKRVRALMAEAAGAAANAKPVAAAAAARPGDAGRRAADGHLRSLGAPQPLHLSIQCALR